MSVDLPLVPDQSCPENNQRLVCQKAVCFYDPLPSYKIGATTSVPPHADSHCLFDSPVRGQPSQVIAAQIRP